MAATLHREDPAKRAIGYMLNVRAELAKRRGEEVTASAQAWRLLPSKFKATMLKAAGLDPLRECMPLSTFDTFERAKLRDAADRMGELAAQLRRVTSS